MTNIMITSDEIESVMAQFRRAHPDMRDAALSGQCDAFALALYERLEGAGINAKLRVISRHRIAMETDDMLDENLMSHVVVSALERDWDVLGPDAIDRWDQDWIQPDFEDEGLECEDIFESEEVSQEQLVALRQKQDARDPCFDFKADSSRLLAMYMANAQLPSIGGNVQAEADYYLRGGCHEFAVALHRAHGFDICVAYRQEDDGDCHVYARDSNGLAWDVLGARPFEAITQERCESVGEREVTVIDVFSDEQEFIEKHVDITQQFERPLSTYTENEISRAAYMADRLRGHPSFLNSPISSPSRSRRP